MSRPGAYDDSEDDEDLLIRTLRRKQKGEQ